ncbi:MAG: glycerophosphodiester phosphodiesterase [Ruminococcaceae bacterium]|nr:glycerophosphodiester phosphodiesterase [Oscillospiraceae bacterium]
MTPFIILAIVFLIIVFMLFPSTRRHPDRKLLESLFIAHRGLHNAKEGIPENSIHAFIEAVVNGYAIENDIHVTSDDEVVVFHDNTLDRMCGVSGRIEDKTLSELRELRLLDTNERIPTLKECLEVIDGRVPLLIEFKCETLDCSKLCEAANKILSDYKGIYFIQSFNPSVVHWYKKNNKNVLRGQLAFHYKGKSLLKHTINRFFANFLVKPDFVAYDQKYADDFRFKLQKLFGAMPIAWTFKSEEELKRGKLKVKSYIFENFRPK